MLNIFTTCAAIATNIYNMVRDRLFYSSPYQTRPSSDRYVDNDENQASNELATEEATKLEARNSESDMQLIEAVKEGNLEAIQSLIDQGVDVNATDTNGVTALIFAVNKEYLEIVELLINNRAEVNAKTDTDRTALMYAARKGNCAIVKLLINKGADVYAEDSPIGHTALQYAMDKEHNEVAEVLKSHMQSLEAAQNQDH